MSEHSYCGTVGMEEREGEHMTIQRHDSDSFISNSSNAREIFHYLGFEMKLFELCL